MSFSAVVATFTISAISSNIAKLLAIETAYSWFVIRLTLVAFIEDPYIFAKEVWICIPFKVMQIIGSGLLVRLE